MKTKEFPLNECNVCVNPNKYEVYNEATNKYIIIETAFIQGFWRGGKSIRMVKYGCGGLPSPYDKPFKTEKECFENELEWAIKYLEREKECMPKFKRAEELLKFDGISKQEADEIKASYLQSKALVEQRAAELENAKIDLNRCDIKAPISGYIGISNITVGALVNANQSEELVNIRDTQTVFVDLSQSYNEILNLKSIGDLEDDIEVSLKFDNGFEYPLKGKLEARELSVDESSQTVTLRAVFGNPNNLLLSGMMTKAILKSKKSIDGFLIPQQAVLRDQKANPIVTLVTPENKTITKIVKIQRSVGNKWLILDGLEQSDKIVVEGLNKINSRSVVSLKDLNSQYKD